MNVFIMFTYYRSCIFTVEIEVIFLGANRPSYLAVFDNTTLTLMGLHFSRKPLRASLYDSAYQIVLILLNCIYISHTSGQSTELIRARWRRVASYKYWIITERDVFIEIQECSVNRACLNFETFA